MSGPITRRYGFPNFEKIFGERDLKHGAEGETAPPSAPSTPSDPPKPADAPSATPSSNAETPKP